MVKLTDEDREALGDWWDGAEDDAWGLATLYPFVEAIVARRVEAALNAAANEIHETAQGIVHADSASRIRHAELLRAARIVRSHTT